ncbi:hypothetical protein [Adlercreutzia caecimuris]|uniref:hypothetical protein n=1 Tax=Adlercreutzia caecimuris TaxID=671266 RepID=UPI001243286E|nr:hypothetical protein [Adlercreutzia caecimuris]NBJ67382.1 hypothetical protein [Adlercreutzia caecimuris]
MVRPKTLRRWRDEGKRRPRKRYSHLSRAQKRNIASRLTQGASAPALAERYGVSIATVYNIPNEYRLKGEASFTAGKERIAVPRIDPADLPDDVDGLKRRCAELELDNAVLEQTIEMLKKTPASIHRI